MEPRWNDQTFSLAKGFDTEEEKLASTLEKDASQILRFCTPKFYLGPLRLPSRFSRTPLGISGRELRVIKGSGLETKAVPQSLMRGYAELRAIGATGRQWASRHHFHFMTEGVDVGTRACTWSSTSILQSNILLFKVSLVASRELNNFAAQSPASTESWHHNLV